MSAFEVVSIDPPNGTVVKLLDFAAEAQSVKITVSSPLACFVGPDDTVTDATGFYVPANTPVVLDGVTYGGSLYVYQLGSSGTHVTAIVHYGQII